MLMIITISVSIITTTSAFERSHSFTCCCCCRNLAATLLSELSFTLIHFAAHSWNFLNLLSPNGVTFVWVSITCIAQTTDKFAASESSVVLASDDIIAAMMASVVCDQHSVKRSAWLVISPSLRRTCNEKRILIGQPYRKKNAKLFFFFFIFWENMQLLSLTSFRYDFNTIFTHTDKKEGRYRGWVTKRKKKAPWPTA